MNELLLEPLRFIVLAGLVLFVVRTIQVMHADLRASASPRQPEAPAPPGEPRLIVETGTADISAGQAFPVHSDMVIGRSPAAHLVLADRYVSTRHAHLALRDGAVWVSDLGSSNGTFINDHRLTKPAVLGDGDRLRIGRINLRLQWPRT